MSVLDFGSRHTQLSMVIMAYAGFGWDELFALVASGGTDS